jgi:peptidoglycan/LPS O-acetylase OafA/YrhL
MFFHYAFQQGNPHQPTPDTNLWLPSLWAAQYGYLGVNIFFVISGFVITYSAAGQRPATFAWNRWLRIHPTFIACLLATSAIIFIARDPHFSISLKQVVANLIIQCNVLNVDFVDPVYWTISCEVWFYIFVFVGLSIPICRRNADYILILWLILSTFDQIRTHGGSLPGPIMTNYSALFCAGIFLNKLYADSSKKVLHGLLLLYSVALACTLAVMQAYIRFDAVHQAFSPALVVVFLLAGILAVAASPFIVLPKRYHRLAFQIGGLTYPLYLLHERIGAIIINRLQQPMGAVGALLVALATSFILARLMFATVEPRLKRIALSLVWRVPAFARYVEAKPLGPYPPTDGQHKPALPGSL